MPERIRPEDVAETISDAEIDEVLPDEQPAAAGAEERPSILHPLDRMAYDWNQVPRAKAALMATASGGSGGFVDRIAGAVGAPFMPKPIQMGRTSLEQQAPDASPEEKSEWIRRMILARRAGQNVAAGDTEPDPVADPYTYMRDGYRAQDDKLRADHPGIYYPAEFAGAVASAKVLPGGPKGAGALNVLGRVGVRSVLPGAAMAVGYGRPETLEDTAKLGAIGGGMGAALHGPAALVGRGVQWAGQQGKKWLGQAVDRIAGRVNTEQQAAHAQAVKATTSAADKRAALAEREHQQALAAHAKQGKAAEREYQQAQGKYQKDYKAAQRDAAEKSKVIRQRIEEAKAAEEGAAKASLRPQAEKDAAEYLMEAEAKKAASAPAAQAHGAAAPDIEAQVQGRWAQAHQEVAHRVSTAKALGIDLERLAQDAPPGVADDVAAVVEKVRQRYAANSLEHFIRDPDVVAAEYRAELQQAMAGKGPAARLAATKVGPPGADTLVAERLAAPQAPPAAPEPTRTTIAKPLQAPPKARLPAKSEPTQNLRATPAPAAPERATPLPAEPPTAINFPEPPKRPVLPPPPEAPVAPTTILPKPPALVPEGDAALADPRVQAAIAQGQRELRKAAMGGAVKGAVFGHFAPGLGHGGGALGGALLEVSNRAMRSDPALAALGLKVAKLASVDPARWGSVAAFLGRAATPQELLMRVKATAAQDPEFAAMAAGDEQQPAAQ